MSRVYFHTEHEGDAEVSGSERAHMGLTCGNIAASLIPRWQYEIVLERCTPEMAAQLSRAREGQFTPDLEASFVGGHRDIFTYKGMPVDNFSLILNTVLAVGSDPLCLFARLHGQCEIHAYVEGPHRAWLADVIEQGLLDGLYREVLAPEITPGVRAQGEFPMGWRDVVALLRHGDDQPVVTSYSVCDQFPSPEVTTWQPANVEDEDTWEAWYELPDDERWRRGMEALRGLPQDQREISPATLRARFGHSLTLFDIFAQR